VTVVSREDQNRVVASLTEDLIEKAKMELAGSVTGSYALIESTIETEVTEKSFKQELGEEAQNITGNITLTVRGLSYSEDDLRKLFAEQMADTIPDGYVLSPERVTLKIVNAKVRTSDDTTQLSVEIRSVALPDFQVDSIRSQIAGKGIDQAAEELKRIQGVSGMEVRFSWSLSQSKLPVNGENISISIAQQQ